MTKRPRFLYEQGDSEGFKNILGWKNVILNLPLQRTKNATITRPRFLTEQGDSEGFKK